MITTTSSTFLCLSKGAKMPEGGREGVREGGREGEAKGWCETHFQ